MHSQSRNHSKVYSYGTPQTIQFYLLGNIPGQAIHVQTIRFRSRTAFGALRWSRTISILVPLFTILFSISSITITVAFPFSFSFTFPFAFPSSFILFIAFFFRRILSSTIRFAISISTAIAGGWFAIGGRWTATTTTTRRSFHWTRRFFLLLRRWRLTTIDRRSSWGSRRFLGIRLGRRLARSGMFGRCRWTTRTGWSRRIRTAARRWSAGTAAAGAGRRGARTRWGAEKEWFSWSW